MFRERCASCHGALRYGGYAPPLIPQALEKRSDEALVAAILSGLPNTQMPGFAPELDGAGARALVAYLRRPVARIAWSVEDIARSRLEYPVLQRHIPLSVRRDNLLLVVERGTGSISVLDGDTLRELDRFVVGAIHGGIKFDQGLRKAFAATRDGTLVEYDLEDGGLRAKVKVGVNTRNLAVTPGGEFVVAANQLPASLAILDGRLHPLAILPLEGQPSAVYPLPGGEELVLALRDRPLLYRLDLPSRSLRERPLPEPFEDFVLVPGGKQLVASSRDGKRLQLYDLEREAVVASLATQGLPHLFSACFFERDGILHAAFNHIGLPELSVVRMDRFELVKRIPVRGAGFFARTHPGTPYLWVDTNSEEIELVDKRTLEVAQRLVPEAGKPAMHVEFSDDGSRAYVSIWHDAGAVVVYDSTGLEEIARLPYAMPVGKYNARNKAKLTP